MPVNPYRTKPPVIDTRKKKAVPKPKQHKHWLLIRNFTTTSSCHVWLMARDGAARFALLHGEMQFAKAEKLAEVLGLPVVRETKDWQMKRA